MADREERIRQRAYELWEREGRPEGREQEHWQQAEAEIKAGEPGPSETHTPAAGASGLSSGLQPSGTTPGGGPGAAHGSIGTGGASSGATGNVRKSGRRSSP